MKKHTSFPSIEQFRNVVASLNRQFSFVGLDDKGEAIYDPAKEKPVLLFKGTVKLHGTNAGVCFNDKDGMWAQSRENIITPEQDNAGFAFFAETNKEAFMELFNSIKTKYSIDTTINTIAIYGEWAGKGIQSGVAISKIDKSFFIFGVKIAQLGNVDFRSYWVDSSFLENTEKRIYNVEKFETYSIYIDFNMPQLVQNKLGEITKAVELECPIGKALGISGVGEGVVWITEYKDVIHRFKVKGAKHSVSKVKTLAPVDTEKLESIVEFVEYSVTENRINQAIEKVFGDTSKLDVTKLGDFIRWVINDIVKEESDTMASNKIEPKDVNKYVSAKAREMFFTIYNSKL